MFSFAPSKISIEIEYEGIKKRIEFENNTSDERVMQRIRCMFPNLLFKTTFPLSPNQNGNTTSAFNHQIIGLMDKSDNKIITPIKYGYLKNNGIYSILINTNNSVSLSHPNVNCDICRNPLSGIRFKCNTCPDFDACSTCFGALNFSHDLTHSFFEIPLCWQEPATPLYFIQKIQQEYAQKIQQNIPKNFVAPLSPSFQSQPLVVPASNTLTDSISLNATPSQVSVSMNKLGHKLICWADKNKNCLISPFNILEALTILLNGASGTAKTEIERALSFENISISDINKEWKNNFVEKYIKQSQQGKATINNACLTLATPNVWFTESFSNSIYQTFNTTVYNVNFKDPSTTGQINTWVSNATLGKIPNIISFETIKDSIFCIITALYFKSKWLNPFNSALTAQKNFYLFDGSAITTQFMTKSDDFYYLEGPGIQVISLPYQDPSMSMVIILPEKVKQLEELVTLIFNNSSYFDAILNSLKNKRKVSLSLPKFRLEWSGELSSSLKNLGINSAFENNLNNFNQLTPVSSSIPVKISNVIHKVVVEVDETGTEAAAATAIAFSFGSSPQITSMIVDRPFLFFIVDKQNSSVLFSGKIFDPTTRTASSF